MLSVTLTSMAEQNAQNVGRVEEAGSPANAIDLLGEELKQLYKYRKQAGIAFAERHAAINEAAIAVLREAVKPRMEEPR
jgi:hypothetical protein